LCEETDGDEEGAGEFKVDGDNEEHGEELSGLETGGIFPPRKWERDESGRTNGRGLGLAFGRESRLPTNSLLASCLAFNNNKRPVSNNTITTQ
jgi:hypothetical protein